MTKYMNRDEAIREATKRMTGALDADPPTNEQAYSVGVITGMFIDIAAAILMRTPPGRNQSLALTAAEDAKMRAVKAIFEDAE